MKLLRRRRDDHALFRAVQARHPGFRDAVLADLALARRQRGDRRQLTSRRAVAWELAKLLVVSDALGALALYRLKAACQRQGIPVVPRVAHRMATMWAQVSIGDPVLIHPGVYLPHGQVVIDGFVEIHSGVKIRPFVTIGLKEGDFSGATIHRGVKVGTGAKIIGPVTIGADATIGANAVVVSDVPAGAVAVGVPARVVNRASDDRSDQSTTGTCFDGYDDGATNHDSIA